MEIRKTCPTPVQQTGYRQNENDGVVSIVTPSRNQGEFIKNTIDSVLGQSYPHIEYLVVDAESEDDTISILKSYGDRISWLSEPDEGQAQAINKGMRVSSGRYLCYLNSDDTLEPNAISDLVQCMVETPDCDVVYGKADYIDRDGDFLSAYGTRAWSLERLKAECFICQPATMWTRECLEKYGYFDESLEYAIDYEFWIRIAVGGGTLIYLPEKLANSRHYPETKTNTGRWAAYREIYRISRKYFGHLSKYWYFKWVGYILFEAIPLPKIFLKSYRFSAIKLVALCRAVKRRLA